MRLRNPFHRERPVYVVAGYKRSGTTMMMQALEAGGMKVDRARRGDELRQYYELSDADRRSGWPDYMRVGDFELPIGQRFPARHKGRLIKCLAPMARYCDPLPAGYVVVFMRRQASAIDASAQHKFGYGFDHDQVDEVVASEIKVWKTRADCPVRFIELWYDDVLADPLGTMRQLREFGFTINPKRAARVIDSARHPLVPAVA